jgi:hypothetical protein
MFVGVLMLDTRFPRPPGDIGSPLTFERAGIPVRFVTVAGASAARVVVEGDRSLIAAFIDAARQLAQEGAALITTSCGFLAAFQDDIARAVDVPVVTSSLLQAASLQQPGIVTFDAASLGDDILRAAGVPAGTPVRGLRPGCELHRRILDDDTTLDLGEAERNIVEAAEALVRQHPHVENIVLECTNMPPYRDAVVRATGRRVHDIETLVLERWRALHPG